MNVVAIIEVGMLSRIRFGDGENEFCFQHIKFEMHGRWPSGCIR